MSIFSKKTLAVAVATATLGFSQVGSAAIGTFTEDFEAMDASSPFALALTGWGRYTSAWLVEVGGSGLFLYDYQGAAANASSGGGQMSAVAGGEGGVDQGAQYLNVFSDYDNPDHGSGVLLDVNIFQQFTLDAADVAAGNYNFTFDAKLPFGGGPDGASTATAFVKTLDPNAGYATTNNVVLDTTTLSDTDWASFTLSLDLSDPALEGQLLQIGFNNTASNYEGSGVYYDNLNFEAGAPIPVPAAAWLFGSALLGLAGIGRKRRA